MKGMYYFNRKGSRKEEHECIKIVIIMCGLVHLRMQ